MTYKTYFIAALLLLAPLRAPAAEPRHVSIAAAANLVYALDALDAEFSKGHPDVAVTTATGASGNLVAQIRNGAPFDVFLSADMDFPRQLIKDGGAGSPEPVLFATGRLVLWTTRPGLDPASIAAIVRNPTVQKLAIANPATAPYGRAAAEALAKLGVADAAKPKLVVGENITQTAQFVETGNADAGFVALSLVLSPKLKDRGKWTEVSPTLYSSLDQGAVLTKRGAGNSDAAAYLEFLAGPEARKILERFGYGVPIHPSTP